MENGFVRKPARISLACEEVKPGELAYTGEIHAPESVAVNFIINAIKHFELSPRGWDMLLDKMMEECLEPKLFEYCDKCAATVNPDEYVDMLGKLARALMDDMELSEKPQAIVFAGVPGAAGRGGNGGCGPCPNGCGAGKR